MKQTEVPFFYSVNRLISEGKTRYEISQLLGISISAVTSLIHWTNRGEKGIQSFRKRDFELTETEIMNIGNYKSTCIDLERITNAGCDLSFHERLMIALQ